MQAGDGFFQKKQYANAILEYKQAGNIDQRDVAIHKKLAEAYVANEDAANAYREYLRIADLQPDDVRAQLTAGQILLLTGQYEDARGYANKVIAKDSSNVDAQILLGNALAGLHDLDAALSTIESAIQLHPGDASPYATLGALQLARGANKDAEAAFKNAVRLSPTSASAQLALANYYWSLNRRAEAEASLRKAFDLEPNNVIVNRALAMFLLTSGRADEGEKHLKLLVQIGGQARGPRLALADYYMGVRRYAEARALLNDVAREKDGVAAAKVRLASITRSEGHPQEAMALIDDVLKAQPTDLFALVVKGQFLLADQKPEEAVTLLRQAVLAYPRSIPAQFSLGVALSTLGDTDAAIQAFNEVLKLNPSASDAALQLGRLFLAAGRSNEAVQFARQAEDANPQSADAALLTLSALVSARQLSAADEKVRMILAAYPTLAAAHAQAGVFFLAKHDNARARAEFDRTLALDPRSIDALNGLVSLDLAERKPQAAVARVNAALGTGTPSAALLLVAARAHAATGNSARAEALLKQAIDADPKNFEAFVTLGQLYAEQHRLPEAEAEFSKLADARPKSVSARTMLGIVMQLENKMDAAKAAYEKAVSIDSSAAVAANNLAFMLVEQSGNLDQALQLAQAAKVRMPDDPDVNDTLGWVYCKRNLPSLAIAPLKAAVAKNPKHYLYQYHLGVAYAGLNDKVNSQRALGEALRLNPNFDGAAHAKELLAQWRD